MFTEEDNEGRSKTNVWMGQGLADALYNVQKCSLCTWWKAMWSWNMTFLLTLESKVGHGKNIGLGQW